MHFNDMNEFHWGQCPDSTGGQSGLVTPRSDVVGDVYCELPFSEFMKFQNYRATLPPFEFRSKLIKLEKTSGKLVSMLPDFNTSVPNGLGGLAQMQDYQLNEQGNIYIRGNLKAIKLMVGSDTAQYYGGNNDMFIIKYGVPCSNTTPLIAAASPVEVIAKCNGKTSLQITWKEISHNEDKLYLYRSLSATGPFVKYDSLAPNSTTYTDANVVSKTSYWYALTAHNVVGEGYLSKADSARLCDDVGGGINSLIATNYLQVYPNPATKQLTVSSYQLTVNTIEVMDVLGRVVLAVAPSPLERAGVRLINVAHLPSGIYTIKTTDEKGHTSIGKFVKE
jgi:hypothetical protein